MKRSVFDFTDYRSFLTQALATQGAERGSRSRLAEALGVQKGFVSAVLHGHTDFSLEQAFRVSQHLLQTEEEREYFLLLVQKDRAGSKDLAQHFSKKIEETQARRREIKERITSRATLTEADQLAYYSSWHYTAIHMCLMVPETQTAASISQYLGLPVSLVSRVLEFFLRTGLAKENANRYTAGPTRIHLPSDSQYISKHHTNWRMQAIHALDRNRSEDLHYSSIMSISKEAAERIRALLLEAIERAEPVIREAKDEGVFTLAMDLFEVKAYSAK